MLRRARVSGWGGGSALRGREQSPQFGRRSPRGRGRVTWRVNTHPSSENSKDLEQGSAGVGTLVRHARPGPRVLQPGPRPPQE